MRSTVLYVTLLSALAIAAACEASAVCSPPAAPCVVAGQEGTWMPDVARRRAELLARVESFAAGSRNREASQPAGKQWWRQVAARPAARGTR